MIRLLVNDEELHQFEDLQDAVTWIEQNPRDYGFNPDNLLMLNDEPFEGLPEIIDEIKHQFQCQGCGALISFSRTPNEKEFYVTCPECETTHGVKVNETAS